MEILKKETVTRYLVELDEGERALIKAGASRQWLTPIELQGLLNTLGVHLAPQEFLELFRSGPALAGWCTVHVLRHGRPLCQFTRWPPVLWGGDKWVSVGDLGERPAIEQKPQTRACATCWEIAELLAEDKWI